MNEGHHGTSPDFIAPMEYGGEDVMAEERMAGV
jgi:hypothetical protein